MEISELIPKDKFDIETANKLPNYTYEELKPIIPELLTWIQDMNWPVSKPVANYLQTLTEHLSNDIIEILQGTDDIWKYWTLHVFGLWNLKPLNELVRKEIERIAITPTESERTEEVDQIANELLGEQKYL